MISDSFSFRAILRYYISRMTGRMSVSQAEWWPGPWWLSRWGGDHLPLQKGAQAECQGGALLTRAGSSCVTVTDVSIWGSGRWSWASCPLYRVPRWCRSMSLRTELETYCYTILITVLELLLDNYKAVFQSLTLHWLTLIIRWLLVTSRGVWLHLNEAGEECCVQHQAKLFMTQLPKASSMVLRPVWTWATARPILLLVQPHLGTGDRGWQGRLHCIWFRLQWSVVLGTLRGLRQSVRSVESLKSTFLSKSLKHGLGRT